jgi:hypothetical protein
VDGFKNSSTGVPIVITIVGTPASSRAFVVKWSFRFSSTSCSSGSACSSRNGIFPERTVSMVFWFKS